MPLVIQRLVHFRVVLILEISLFAYTWLGLQLFSVFLSVGLLTSLAPFLIPRWVACAYASNDSCDIKPSNSESLYRWDMPTWQRFYSKKFYSLCYITCFSLAVNFRYERKMINVYFLLYSWHMFNKMHLVVFGSVSKLIIDFYNNFRLDCFDAVNIRVAQGSE